MGDLKILNLPITYDEDMVRLILERGGIPDFDGTITISLSEEEGVATATICLGSTDDADEIVASLNGMYYEGINLQVTLDAVQGDEEEEENEKRTFAIGNLPDSHCDKQKLDPFMRKFGPLEWICVEREEHFGFVQYHHNGDADEAFRVIDQQIVDGRSLFCHWIAPRVWGRVVRRQPRSRTLALSNLPTSIQNEAQFEEFCEELGSVESVTYVATKHTGSCSFHTRADAERAFRSLSGKMIEGKLLQVNYKKDGSEMKNNGATGVTTDSRNVRVNNLPASLRIESAFERLCTKYGPVESVIVLKTGPVGFCQFATHDAAQKAMGGLNGFQIDGSTLRVSWGENKDHQPKAKRTARRR